MILRLNIGYSTNATLVTFLQPSFIQKPLAEIVCTTKICRGKSKRSDINYPDTSWVMAGISRHHFSATRIYLFSLLMRDRSFMIKDGWGKYFLWSEDPALVFTTLIQISSTLLTTVSFHQFQGSRRHSSRQNRVHARTFPTLNVSHNGIGILQFW